jgi:TatD family-associated radical SAM protein
MAKSLPRSSWRPPGGPPADAVRKGPRPSPSVAYRFGEGVYLNLTNRCPTRCVFCAKKALGYRFHGSDLALSRGEPAVETVWSELLRESSRGPFSEIVFCGFGEPTYRLAVLMEICRRARRVFPNAARRLNTIGLGSVIQGRDITGDLASVLDAVRVSLNTADEIQWRLLHGPLPEFEGSYPAVLAFIAACVKRKLKTTVTAIELREAELGKVEALAASLGAGFLPRPRIDAPSI